MQQSLLLLGLLQARLILLGEGPMPCLAGCLDFVDIPSRRTKPQSRHDSSSLRPIARISGSHHRVCQAANTYLDAIRGIVRQQTHTWSFLCAHGLDRIRWCRLKRLMTLLVEVTSDFNNKQNMKAKSQPIINNKPSN